MAVMTFEESIKQLDALYAANGKDYVVHSGNHPEILRAWSDHALEQMEAEISERPSDFEKS